MQTRPSTQLSTLLAELRELPDGLATPVGAGLVVVDTMRALGHADVVIELLTGIDPRALDGAHAEVTR